MSRRNQRHFMRFVFGVLFCIVASSDSDLALAQPGPSFQGLGVPDDAISSFALGVSADGSVVVGYSESASGREAFRWTQATGMVGLGDFCDVCDPPEGDFDSIAYGVSADGSVIVGFGSPFEVEPNSGSGRVAFRWKDLNGNGQVDDEEKLDNHPEFGLGDLPGGLLRGRGLGVSADGSVVVGESGSTLRSRAEAFRWEDLNGNGEVDDDEKLDNRPEFGLGDLGEGFSSAIGVSADGSIVVGGSSSSESGPFPPNEAFRWTEATGMVGLGFLPGGVFDSFAAGVSPDGSVIVGGSRTPASAQFYEAFRWTEATGMVSLGLGGGLGTVAVAVSEDGSVIVGQANTPSTAAFIWDPVNGVRFLRTVLVNDFGLGPELTGWGLANATMSESGRVIVGSGRNPDGDLEGWMVILPECMADAECDDGLFCSGVETCVDNVCTSSGDPCQQGQTCDEQDDTCGPFCGDGFCDPGEDSCNCPNDCGAPAQRETPGTTCSDRLDNDCDGDADCDDPDCDDDPDCEGVPTVSQWGMAVLLVALLAGIALKFRRFRTM